MRELRGGGHHAASKECEAHPIKIKERIEEEKKKIERATRKNEVSYAKIAAGGVEEEKTDTLSQNNADTRGTTEDDGVPDLQEGQNRAAGGRGSAPNQEQIHGQRGADGDRSGNDSSGSNVRSETDESDFSLQQAKQRHHRRGPGRNDGRGKPTGSRGPERERSLVEFGKHQPKRSNGTEVAPEEGRHQHTRTRRPHNVSQPGKPQVRCAGHINIRGPEDHTTCPSQANHRSDVLDIYLIKNVRTSVPVTRQCMDSDHFPVVVKVFNPRQDENRREIQKTNWMRFAYRCSLLNYEPREIAKEEIEIAAEQLTNDVKEALERSKLAVERRRWNKWNLTQEEKEILKKKYEAKKKWNATKEERHKREFNRLKRRVDLLIEKKKEDRWTEKIEEIEENSNALWPILKTLGKRKQPNAPVEQDGRWLYADKEKAEAIASFLERQFTCEDTTDQKTKRMVDQSWNEVKRWGTVEPQLASEEEIQAIIKGMSSKKAPGEDNIPNRAMKTMGVKPVAELTRIVNACLQFSFFPNKWKRALIVTLPKGEKDPTNMKNRRPISLLNGFAKILERVIKERITRWVEEKKILPSEQFGFRTKLAAVQQAMNLVEDIKKKQKRRKFVGAALLDVEKAYDKIWRRGLIHKMRRMPIPSYLTKIVQEWLEDRAFRVRVNEEKSEERRAREGLPQGSPLSPILFNLYVKDMPQVVDKEIALFQFADDTAIVAQGQNAEMCLKKIERNLKKIGDHARRWKMRLNEDKTQLIQFSKKRPRRPGISWNGKTIKAKKQGTYLGILLDSNLDFRKHTKRRGLQAARKIGNFYPLIREGNNLSTRTRMRIYNIIGKPVSLYGEEIWAEGSEKAKQIAEVGLRKLVRRCVAIPWFVRNEDIRRELNLEDISTRAATRRQQAIERMKNHEDVGIRRVGAEFEQ
ncbi:zinc finger associated protein [Popillia japonica]|uniref:Zinc finger associated protein n=1 Tax=Popillia japonica TaxID=7064 RepID=A0AAW1KFN4_POPJA